MTGESLRSRVAATISKWEGAARGSATHKSILDVYNAQQPLPRGYKMQTGDAWCAATASAAYILAGVAAWTGTECSCAAWVELARKRGIWIESDTYIPQIGDAVLYDWQDGPNYRDTDNHGAPDHIGIVIASAFGRFTVMEGNKGSASQVGRREMQVGGRYIRGFLAPDFDAAAAALTAAEEREKEEQKRMEIREFLDALTPEDCAQLAEKCLTGLPQERRAALVRGALAVLTREQQTGLARDAAAWLSAEDCFVLAGKAQEYAAELMQPEWAREEYGEAVTLGLTDGRRPQCYATRLETALMVKRAVHNASVYTDQVLEDALFGSEKGREEERNGERGDVWSYTSSGRSTA